MFSVGAKRASAKLSEHSAKKAARIKGPFYGSLRHLLKGHFISFKVQKGSFITLQYFNDGLCSVINSRGDGVGVHAVNVGCFVVGLGLGDSCIDFAELLSV